MKQTSETVFMNGTDSNDIMLFGDIIYMNGAEGGGSQYPAWENMPADWSDIRLDCPKNSIALYAAHNADYSSYDNLGFTATCTGGYKVYIDGNVYGSYSSGSTCNITWSTSGITTGDDITTPSALKAHKIWISPATEGNNITAFQCKRVAASGNEQQGVLWAHFNLTNTIKIIAAFGSETSYNNKLLRAVTAKNNLITYAVSSSLAQSGFYATFAACSSLEYLPILKAESQTYASSVYIPFRDVPAKTVVIKNNSGLEGFGILNQSQIEELDIENGLTLASNVQNLNDAHGATKLKKWPKTNLNKGENFQMFNCPSLEPVNIDDRFNDIRKVFRFYGTQSTPTPALKSLRVSNQAPFDGAEPQINVSYTGMNRAALVQLFNDLPTVSGGQVVNVTGTTGSEDLTVDDVMIAVNKGWTVSGGPQPIPNWQLGDRLDNKATFVGYFDSVNPDDSTTQRYAFFALDGNFRQGNLNYRTSSTAVDFLPTYDYTTTTISSHLSEITESGTYAMAKVITAGISDFPIYDKSNSASVSFNGTTYYGKVPNLVELKAIYENRTVIDAVDTSGERTLATWGQWDGSTKNRVFAETLKSTSTVFVIADQSGMYQNGNTYGANNKYGIIPIIEIPVPAGHGA